MEPFQRQLFLLSFLFFAAALAQSSSINYFENKFDLSSSTRILEDLNTENCPNNLPCISKTQELDSNTLFKVLLDINEDERDLTITYQSSVQSQSIKSQIVAFTPGVGLKLLAMPNGNTWTQIILKEELESYTTLGFAVINSSKMKTTISFTITFGIFEGDSSTESTSFLGILLPVIGVVFGLSVLGLTFCYWVKRKQREAARQRRYRQRRRERANSLAINSGDSDSEEPDDILTAENLDTRFPIIKFEACKSSFPQTTCSICLEELQKEADCRQLYCEHIFHSECVRLWLVNQLAKRQASCPNCQISVLKVLNARKEVV